MFNLGSVASHKVARRSLSGWPLSGGFSSMGIDIKWSIVVRGLEEEVEGGNGKRWI